MKKFISFSMLIVIPFCLMMLSGCSDDSEHQLTGEFNDYLKSYYEVIEDDNANSLTFVSESLEFKKSALEIEKVENGTYHIIATMGSQVMFCGDQLWTISLEELKKEMYRFADATIDFAKENKLDNDYYLYIKIYADISTSFVYDYEEDILYIPAKYDLYREMYSVFDTTSISKISESEEGVDWLLQNGFGEMKHNEFEHNPADELGSSPNVFIDENGIFKSYYLNWTYSDEGILIDTEYYTLSVPNSWNDDCFYEVSDGENYNYTLSFYDKANYNTINGGWLFSIDLLTEFEDYSKYPDYDVLGSLEVYRIGSYNIIVTYPTDVQHSEETSEKYREMSEDIPDILKTISYKEECTFSEEPIPIDNNIGSQVSLSADFYAELYTYTVSSCVNYTEWWNNPTLSYTNPTHYYLGKITSENYSEKMDKAKQLVDNVYKKGYWEIRYNGYGKIMIGLYITPDDEVYFCYK